jgi:enamine deaminase RidA (YjgF/YER057c/UK114 family)
MPTEPQFLPEVPGLEGVPTLVIGSGSRTVYFTGQVALDHSGQIVGDTLEEQAVQAFRNLGAACAAVGVTGADIASLTFNVVTDDFDDALGQLLSAAGKVQEEAGADFVPVVAASTMVAVKALYAGALIEVTAIASID